MNPKCNGCGRRDVATFSFRCTWPDARTTDERWCHHCQLAWARQLQSLGARVEELDGGPLRGPMLRIE